MKSKGFTLIELLVVVAIIGILSAIVMAALGTSKDKGNDSAVSSNLANMRSQAELYYSYAGNYGTAAAATSVGNCIVANNIFGTTTAASFKKALDSVAIANNGTVGTSRIVCSTTGSPNSNLAVVASTTDANWCVDSSGVSRKVTGAGLITAAGLCK